MRKHHNRCTTRQPSNIILQPRQLLLAQLSKPATTQPGSTSLFQIQHVDEPDEVHPLVIKALPPQTLCPASKPFAIELPVISKHIVLAGHIKHPAGFDALENLHRRIELLST